MADFDDSASSDQADLEFLCGDSSRLVLTTDEHTENFDSMEALLREMKQAPSIEIPEFDASNVSDWLSKVEQSFRVCRFSDLDKLDLVAFSLEGYVLQWFSWEMSRREFHSWDEFRRRLLLKFGATPEKSSENVAEILEEKASYTEKKGTVSASVTESAELSSQVIELDESHLEQLFSNELQTKMKEVLKLKEPMGLENQTPAVLRMETFTSKPVASVNFLSFEVGTAANLFSGLSQTSQVWEPGGVFDDHVLMDWLMDFNGYDEIVDGIKCLDIGVCSGIKQPIDSSRASRVWERGGLAISTDRLLHSGFDGDKLTELDCHLSENHSQEKVRVEMLMQATSFNGDLKLPLHHAQQNGLLVFPWNLMLLEFFLFFYFGRQAVLDQITKGLEMKKKMKVLKSWMFKYKPATSSSMWPLYVNQLGASDLQDNDKEMVADPVTQAVLNLVTTAAQFGLVSVLIWLTVLRVLWLLGTLFWSTSFKKQKFGKNWWYKFKHSLWQRECGRELLAVEVVLAETVVDVRFDDVGPRELLLQWQNQDASQNSWMLSKDFVLLYTAFKLEDKLRFEGGSIVTTHQSYYRRKRKERKLWDESEGSIPKEASERDGGFAV